MFLLSPGVMATIPEVCTVYICGFHLWRCIFHIPVMLLSKKRHNLYALGCVEKKKQMQPYLNHVLIFDHSWEAVKIQTGVLLLSELKMQNQKHHVERNIAS